MLEVPGIHWSYSRCKKAGPSTCIVGMCICSGGVRNSIIGLKNFSCLLVGSNFCTLCVLFACILVH